MIVLDGKKIFHKIQFLTICDQIKSASVSIKNF